MNQTSFEILAEGTTTYPEGFDAGATASGLKPDNALDLALFRSDRDAAAAGTFTKNQFAAAPVTLDRRTLAVNRSRMRAVVANAGNANACTGEQGTRDAKSMQNTTAEALGLDADQVLVLSTGVIGVPMPMPTVTRGIWTLAPLVGPDGGPDAARAIMTTDTVPKHAALNARTGSGSFRIGGMAKGSGMIHPDMATMLAVLTTDALVAPPLLQMALETAVGASFNAISVDGDTSTNDSVLVLANGSSGTPIETTEARESFIRALTEICTDLAKKIVRDGEGASHFVEIRVEGLPDDAAARAVASTIATSPLVKTALAGGDPNWGRILAAAGRARVPIDAASASLLVASPEMDTPLALVRDGMPTDYAEADAADLFAEHDVIIHLVLGSGPGNATMWTTDLTHEYVRINADYRS